MLKIGTFCSGIGSPEQALKDLNINHSIEFACDIDKYARMTYQTNHTAKIMYEDLTQIEYKNLSDVDLFVAGFPCQSFSVAGKRLGFEDTRGTIFFHILEYLKIKKPDMFILENVKGLLSHDNGNTFDVIINSLSTTVNNQVLMFPNVDSLNYHIHYQVLNSKDYGIPQNRERVFIVGFKDYRAFNFPEKQELKLKLKDVLESEVSDKYYLSEKSLKHIFNNLKTKQIDFNQTYLKIDKKGFLKNNQDIASCLTGGGHSGGNHSDMDILLENVSQANRVYSIDGISSCLVGNAGGGGGKTGLYAIPVLTPNKINKRQNGRRFKNDGEPMFTLTSQDLHGVFDGYRIRRLTPRECARLQGFNDNFILPCSDTQSYKQMGNTITVNVLKEIFLRMELKQYENS